MRWCRLILLASRWARRRPAGRGRRCRERERGLRLHLGGDRGGRASRSGSRPKVAATAPAGRRERPDWSAPCSRSAHRGVRRAGARAIVILPSRYDGSSRWRDGGSEWRVAFAADGRATQVEVPEAELAGARAGSRAAAGRAGPGLAGACRHRPRCAGQPARRPELRRRGRSGSSSTARRPTPAAELACTVSGQLLAGASRAWRERSRSAEAEREPWRVWLRSGVPCDGLVAGAAGGADAVRHGHGTARQRRRHRPPPDRRAAMLPHR